MNQKVVIWIVIAIAVLVLVPLLGMLDMIGTGSMMSRGMGGMMMGWASSGWCCSRPSSSP